MNVKKEGCSPTFAKSILVYEEQENHSRLCCGAGLCAHLGFKLVLPPRNGFHLQKLIFFTKTTISWYFTEPNSSTTLSQQQPLVLVQSKTNPLQALSFCF